MRDMRQGSDVRSQRKSREERDQSALYAEHQQTNARLSRPKAKDQRLRELPPDITQERMMRSGILDG
jgi:hypothetical protein